MVHHLYQESKLLTLEILKRAKNHGKSSQNWVTALKLNRPQPGGQATGFQCGRYEFISLVELVCCPWIASYKFAKNRHYSQTWPRVPPFDFESQPKIMNDWLKLLRCQLYIWTVLQNLDVKLLSAPPRSSHALRTYYLVKYNVVVCNPFEK